MSVFSRLSAKPLPREEIDKQVNRVVQRILEERRPLEIRLFGSAARGEATEVSDLDFCVVLDSAEEIRGASRALYRNGLFADMPIDILWFTEATYRQAVQMGGVGAICAREGKTVYRRDET